MYVNRPLVSVICPVYQEEDVLPHFHRELSAVLDTLAPRYNVEIVYIDDGSKDRTLVTIERFAQDDRRVRFLSLSRNFGKEAAVLAGLEAARGDYVIVMDADLQHPPALIPTLLEKAAGVEVVLAVRRDFRRSGLRKRLLARSFYALMRSLSETDISSGGSDFLLMSRHALDAFLRMRERHRFLKGLVSWLGFPHAEVSFTPEPRRAGQTKFTLGRLINLGSDMLVSFSRAPLRLALYLGSLCIVGTLVGAVWLLGGYLVGLHDGASGWAIALGALYFLAGCILCGLGVIGEYVGRIYEQVKERPIYVVKKSSDAAGASARRLTFDRDAA